MSCSESIRRRNVRFYHCGLTLQTILFHTNAAICQRSGTGIRDVATVFFILYTSVAPRHKGGERAIHYLSGSPNTGAKSHCAYSGPREQTDSQICDSLTCRVRLQRAVRHRADKLFKHKKQRFRLMLRDMTGEGKNYRLCCQIAYLALAQHTYRPSLIKGTDAQKRGRALISYAQSGHERRVRPNLSTAQCCAVEKGEEREEI